MSIKCRKCQSKKEVKLHLVALLDYEIQLEVIVVQAPNIQILL
jgi:hypothetical protein